MTVFLYPTLKYSDIFPMDESVSVEDLLGAYDFDILLNIALSIDSINISGYHGENGAVFNLSETLDRFHVEYGEERSKIRSSILSIGKAIVNRVSTLRLIDIILRIGHQTNYNDKKVGLNMLKAYLLINQKIHDKYYESRSRAIELGYDVPVFQDIFLLIHSVRFEHHTNFDIYFPNLVKSKLYLKFCKGYPALNSHLDDFLRRKKCRDIDDFFRKYFPLIEFMISKFDERYQMIEVPSEHNEYEELCHYLDEMSIEKSIDFDSCDFAYIRSKPMYKIRNGRYVVINEIFLIEKIYKSLYFDFKEINSTQLSPIKNFRQEFTTQFSEKYLLYTVLDKVYRENKGSNFITFSGEELKIKLVNAEPDYYIRKSNKILLIENKDNMINGVELDNSDFEKIISVFKDRINKASRQIIVNIDRCLGQKIEDKEIVNQEIYPVMIVHDNIFMTPALNLLARSWFKGLLGTQDKYSRIKPLTIISIDFFINYSWFIRSNKINLFNYIDKYHKFIDNKVSENNSQKSHYSFFHYIKKSSGTDEMKRLYKDRSLIVGRSSLF
ncbi:hypothetical protein [Larkinella sp. C7]|uniref:hypothetical protein n=1 Tax=Larkinella sp. C7 TaxID=2576607 RepID=UPI0011114295|nr:hypothetical protein [Larkinella sp. C7]